MKPKVKRLVNFIVALMAVFYPGASMAQVIVMSEDSVSAASIFLKIVNWGLVIIVLLGLVSMPVTGLSWYRKNKTDHMWIEFFKSGTFALRLIIIIFAFILWYFKLINRVMSLIF
jgi:hypothetical protein